MKPWLEKTEKIVDKSIPYLLVLLLAVIIIDVFFQSISDKYHTSILAFDYFVISMFVIDLAFKYNRVRNIPQFLKRYWLDIIAIFPFFLFFRLIEESLILSEELVSRLQKFFHAEVVIEEGALIAEETAKTGRLAELGRSRMLTRIIRPIQRLPRLLKAFEYYEKPGHKHKKKK